MQRNYNILREPWLRVQRKDESRSWITLAEILEPENLSGTNPIIKLDLIREDFNVTTARFVIGMFQLLYAPEDTMDWADMWENPPTPEDFLSKSEIYLDSFWLDGDGPRFFQYENKQGESPIDILFPEFPSETKIDSGLDFKTSELLDYVSMPFIAQTLINYSFMNKAASQSYIQTAKGDYSQIFLLEGNTLWKSIWNNVTPIEHMRQGFDDTNPNWEMTNPEDIFLWTNKKALQAEKITVHDALAMHPAAVFFISPIRLHINFYSDSGSCDLYPDQEGVKATFSRAAFSNDCRGIEWSFAETLLNLYRSETKGKISWPADKFESSEVNYDTWMDLVLPLKEAQTGFDGTKSQPPLNLLQVYQGGSREFFDDLPDTEHPELKVAGFYGGNIVEGFASLQTQIPNMGLEDAVRFRLKLEEVKERISKRSTQMSEGMLKFPADKPKNNKYSPMLEEGKLAYIQKSNDLFDKYRRKLQALFAQGVYDLPKNDKESLVKELRDLTVDTFMTYSGIKVDLSNPQLHKSLKVLRYYTKDEKTFIEGNTK